MSARDEVLGNMTDESFFGFERSFAIVCKTDAVGYAEHVGVDSHSRLIETNGSDDVSSLSTYAW